MVQEAKDKTEKGKGGGLLSRLISPFRGKKSAPEPHKIAATDAADAAIKSAPDLQAGLTWPGKRLNVVEKLWGEGYLNPGGAEYVKLLLPLLGLDEKKSLLLVGAGLGGIGETMVEETGVWVSGYEADKELAKLGQESMKRANLQRKAPVRYDPLESLKLKPKSFDAMMSFETVHTVVDKQALFTSITDALRLDADMLFTSFVLPDTNPPNAKVEAWAHTQDMPPHLWPVEAMVGMLKGFNLDVRPFDDITVDYRKRVLIGWMGFLNSISKAELMDMADAVMAECTRWAALISAIDSGGLKVVKFHAIKLPDKRKPLKM